ncbi:hypothetical protein [Halomonas halophila]|uniref:hypothetical protein n=1 Tax=Halomonas halophila TaxID=29573 RepID=UPI003636F187
MSVRVKSTATAVVDSSHLASVPAVLRGHGPRTEDVHRAHVLAMLGDSVTTDHISPAGAIKPDRALAAGARRQAGGIL